MNVEGIQSVRFASGEYTFGSIAVLSTESIQFNGFTLKSTGAISLKAEREVTSVETGLLGFLGAVSQNSTSIRIVDSGLFGNQIEVLASTSIQANADGDDDEDVQRDFARIKTVGVSEIVIGGTTIIEAAADLSLKATTVQTASASAVASPTSNNASRDAALALTNITSDATITLSDTFRLSAGNQLSLLADNKVTVTTVADGSLAGANGKGGIVALAELNGRTQVLMSGDGTMTAGSLQTNATSTANVTTTAKSTVGGANANDSSTQSDLLGNDAQTSSGGLGLAAAYARSKIQQITEVVVAGAISVNALRDAVLDSNASTTVNTSADAGATNHSGDSGSGVGIAIALDRTTNTNRVELGGNLKVRAATLTVRSDSLTGDQHTTKAVSGIGASNVGGAGAFASNKVSQTTQSLLSNDLLLDSGRTSLILSASSEPTLVSEAKPTITTDRIPKKGLGASVARNKLTSTTDASVADRASVSGGSGLQLLANTVENITTNSETGSTGGSSLTASVSMAVVDSQTTAKIGSGSAIPIVGNVQVQATRSGDILTKADGTSVGQNAARGGSFALNDIDSETTASVDRPMTSTGNFSILSSVNGKSESLAKASVEGTGNSSADSDQQTLAEQQAGGSDKVAPSADALGKVSFGAATAIQMVDWKSSSNVLGSARLDVGQALSVVSSNASDSSAKADASAVGSGVTSGDTTIGGTEKGRAVAVAINKAALVSETNVRASAILNAGNGITLIANTSVAEDNQRTFSSEAISGLEVAKRESPGALRSTESTMSSEAKSMRLLCIVAMVRFESRRSTQHPIPPKQHLPSPALATIAAWELRLPFKWPTTRRSPQ